MNHIIESRQLDKVFIDSIFSIADKFEKQMSIRDSQIKNQSAKNPSTKNNLTKQASAEINGQPLKGKIMASLFYEPSTRTRFSFESAMIRLGGHVITAENAREFSSAAKGETIEDTIKVMNNYADVIVMRHHEIGSAKRAAAVSDVPVINAGDGAGEHPTQALLDLYTIQKLIGKLDGVSIALVGDLKYGRTIRSLIQLLSKYKNVKIYCISPRFLRIGDDIRDLLKKENIDFEESPDLDTVIKKVDVLYQTRIQKERFARESLYQKYKGCYEIRKDVAGAMKKQAIIMHPLPRVGEIHAEVDDLPQAAYFKQAKFAVLVRMALLLRALT